MIYMYETLEITKPLLVIAFTVLYIGITMIASELFNFTAGGGGALEFKRSKAAKQKVKAATAPSDVENRSKERVPSNLSRSSETLDVAKEEETLQQISGSENIFTWEDVEYSVPYSKEYLFPDPIS